MNGPGETAVSVASRHALEWLIVGNSVGLWLSLLLIWPDLQSGEWTYGRWVPAHLNVQLFGWTSLPLVAWLFSIYEVDLGRARAWGPAAVWGWSAALVAGMLSWLQGNSSGKIFLDWKGGALAAFLLAQMILWWVLAVAWRDRAGRWSPRRRWLSLAGLLGLATVPLSLAFACSPTVYPPVDRTTGGPTGASLLGSTLVVVGLMLMLPRVAGIAGRGRAGCMTWLFFALSWLAFGVVEKLGGTHFDAWQIGALTLLLPWIWLLPRDWSGFQWPAGSGGWRMAMLAWWALLVVTGLLTYQPGWLDRLKFTQGLVAHSHLAMAGFTTSFCGILLGLLTGRQLGDPRSLALWHGAAFVMVLALAFGGWHEGGDFSWMAETPTWRWSVFGVRALCGAVMTGVSVYWLKEWRKS